MNDVTWLGSTMGYVRDIDLIEYVGGQLPPEENRRVAEHLAACER